MDDGRMMLNSMVSKIESAAEFIRSKYTGTPLVGIILGSGLGKFVSEIEVAVEIGYDEIPHFPVSTVEGHKGKLVIGHLEGKVVVVLAGRCHFYEGYSVDEIVFPIRVLKLLGITKLIISNAAGGVHPDFEVGDLMIIKDHISFFTPNPLVGPNLDSFGPRFPDMSEPYDKNLIRKAKEIGTEMGITLHEGVYLGVTGPTFETPAEYQLIKLVGGDAVGMSTVQEAIVARHMSIAVFAVSVITDLGIPVNGAVPITHEEVLHAANEAEPVLAGLVKRLIAGAM